MFISLQPWNLQQIVGMMWQCLIVLQNIVSGHRKLKDKKLI